jgi:hypothetical protein
MKYTEPFYTKDIHIWVEPTAADPTVDDLTQPHIAFQFGMAPVVAHALACRGELEFAVRTVG